VKDQQNSNATEEQV